MLLLHASLHLSDSIMCLPGEGDGAGNVEGLVVGLDTADAHPCVAVGFRVVLAAVGFWDGAIVGAALAREGVRPSPLCPLVGVLVKVLVGAAVKISDTAEGEVVGVSLLSTGVGVLVKMLVGATVTICAMEGAGVAVGCSLLSSSVGVVVKVLVGAAVTLSAAAEGEDVGELEASVLSIGVGWSIKTLVGDAVAISTASEGAGVGCSVFGTLVGVLVMVLGLAVKISAAAEGAAVGEGGISVGDVVGRAVAKSPAVTIGSCWSGAKGVGEAVCST